ncbi:MFS transporter, partial [Streptomyces diastatochromogenes]
WPSVSRARLLAPGAPPGPPTPAAAGGGRAHLIAQKTGSAHLAASANSAYVHGMGVVLLVCGVAALVSALLAAAFLPNTPVARRTEREQAPAVAAPAGDAGQ